MNQPADARVGAQHGVPAVRPGVGERRTKSATDHVHQRIEPAPARIGGVDQRGESYRVPGVADDYGYAEAVAEDFPEDLHEAVLTAEDACTEWAIKIADETEG